MNDLGFPDECFKSIYKTYKWTKCRPRSGMTVNGGHKVDQEVTRGKGRQTIRQLTKLVSQATHGLVDNKLCFAISIIEG